MSIVKLATIIVISINILVAILRDRRYSKADIVRWQLISLIVVATS